MPVPNLERSGIFHIHTLGTEPPCYKEVGLDNVENEALFP